MHVQRIQDRICTLAKEGRWQEIVAEKRAALQQIKHTLDTYHRLLTQAPVPADGVLKLLQSIVRCALHPLYADYVSLLQRIDWRQNGCDD